MRDVAQLVAHYVRDVGVAGSNPVIPTEESVRIYPLVFYALSRTEYSAKTR